MFLDSQNAILKENLGKRILNKVREPCELKFSDFDNIQFKLSVQQDSPQIAKVSVACDAWSTLSKNGSRSRKPVKVNNTCANQLLSYFFIDSL